jgi:hypothetical protein
VPTLGGAPEIVVSSVFDEEGFDSCLRCVSLEQTNTKTNTLEPNTFVSLVFSWN